jgi:surface antigen
VTRIRRLVGALAAALLVLAGLLVVPSPVATAAQTELCSGYAGCAEKGYGNRGYRAESDRMWWRMYTGHNCTNYVAFRMVQSGMSPERPWEGSGNASNWGHAMSRITDDVPMVGSVAWWDSNQGYAGSNGHVAYVERVVSPREIIVSEDFWGGDFHWRRITKGDSYWPNGFIHFNDKAVEPVEKPTITGEAAVGETLTATTGEWTPAAKRRIQWYAAGKPIPGATEATFTPSPAQRRMRLSVEVLATRKGYAEGRASSPRSPKVQPGTLVAAAQPRVEGTPRVEEVLTLDRGATTPVADRTTVRWLADGEPVRGAEGDRLRLTPDLVGARITAEVVSVREGYHDLLTSAEASGRVEPGRIRTDRDWSLSGKPARGERLVVDSGRVVSPADAEVTYTWLRDGEPIGRPQPAEDGAKVLRHRLTSEDVGHVVGVRVEVSRPGYETLTRVLEAERRTTTTSRTEVAARAVVADEGTKRKPDVQRRVVVDVTVEAPGVEGPSGPVLVRLDGQEVEGRLEGGALRLVLRDVSPGKHVVRVQYLGTEVVEGSRSSATVRVAKRPAE